MLRNAVKGMSKEAAMQGYLDAMKDVYKNIFFFILNNKTD